MKKFLLCNIFLGLLLFPADAQSNLHILGAAGMNVSDFGIGGNIDVGVHIKQGLLYAGLGLQFSYLGTENNNVSFDAVYPANSGPNIGQPVVNSFDTNVSSGIYADVFYTNLGINLTRRLSLYGIGSVGVLMGVDTGMDKKNIPRGTGQQNGYHAIGMQGDGFGLRYGLGFQWDIGCFGTSALWDLRNCQNAIYGLRGSYMTGRIFQSPTVDIYPNGWVPPSGHYYENIQFTSMDGMKIESFNLSFFVRGI